MLGTSQEDIAQFLHQEERLDTVSTFTNQQTRIFCTTLTTQLLMLSSVSAVFRLRLESFWERM